MVESVLRGLQQIQSKLFDCLFYSFPGLRTASEPAISLNILHSLIETCDYATACLQLQQLLLKKINI